MSYDGQVCWCMTSDAKLVPDIEKFGYALGASFAELHASFSEAATV